MLRREYGSGLMMLDKSDISALQNTAKEVYFKSVEGTAMDFIICEC
jgi:hypothetical protein